MPPIHLPCLQGAGKWGMLGVEHTLAPEVKYTPPSHLNAHLLTAGISPPPTFNYPQEVTFKREIQKDPKKFNSCCARSVLLILLE